MGSADKNNPEAVKTAEERKKELLKNLPLHALILK